MKKLLLLITAIISFTFNPAFAVKEKTLITVTPLKKLTSSSKFLSEGDYVDFKEIETGDTIRGLITHYEENGFAGKEAVVVIEQFKALNSDKKISGNITLTGNAHSQSMEFLSAIAELCTYVRGGEVTIRPNKDFFNLWSE